ncbi:MAG: DUF421 domain-containing protein [Verrucomicrobiales bacterium]|nr:DUF421 domain-containing protein [Verrucomicrobiales bacterium]
MSDWIATDWTKINGVLLSTICIYAFIILLCKICGLRSFSKMSTADFAMTVAVGSIFASIISSPGPSMMTGAIALAAIFLVQWLISQGRKRTSWLSKLVDNSPVLLMKDGEILQDNLRQSGVTESDLMAKLREANALQKEEVAAVVFETTGDVSVLHGESIRYAEISSCIVEGCRES